jgi:hypothetical protein
LVLPHQPDRLLKVLVLEAVDDSRSTPVELHQPQPGTGRQGLMPDRLLVQHEEATEVIPSRSAASSTGRPVPPSPAPA